MTHIKSNTDRLFNNYIGVPCPMPTPKRGKFIRSFENGKIELWRNGRDDFAVVYGLQIKEGLTYWSATKEIGSCIFHSLNCEGLVP